MWHPTNFSDYNPKDFYTENRCNPMDNPKRKSKGFSVQQNTQALMEDFFIIFLPIGHLLMCIYN